MTEQVDVVVIGLGVAGEEVAGRLAEAGLSVVGVEAGLVGGECPYWGCVPTKMMIRASGIIGEVRRAASVAGRATIDPDWGLVSARIRAEATDSWNDQVAVDRFEGKGGQFVRGPARITGRGEVTVGDRVFTARRGVVVATGTTPLVPPIGGLADLPFWTNRDAVQVEEPPTSLLVIGGGAIGVEFAQVFSRFGTQVTIVEAGAHLLPAEEPEAGETLQAVLEAEGISVHVGAAVAHASHTEAEFDVALGDGTGLSAQKLLVATGRRVDLTGLGLDHYGVDPEARTLSGDERLRVADGLWAVGDVTGHGAFTHVAMYQADIAVRDLLDQGGPAASYHAVPRVTFSDPEVGAVGLTEAQARAAGIGVRIGRSQTPSSARGWIHKVGNEGLVKLVEDADRGVLIGATAVGPHGGEVLGALAVAVHAEVPISTLRQMIYAYPTFHRGIEDAVRDLVAHGSEMTTALVLSGGANLGAAQVGMLTALRESGVRPDLLIGTSVGALNGAWVAADAPLDDLGDLWRSLRRGQVFPADPLRGLLGFAGRSNHLVSDRGLRLLLRHHLRFERLEDAPMPFHVLATDVLTGLGVLLSEGPAVEAILASTAVPGVLPPVPIDGRHYMDGGVVNNTPISHAIELGADTVWVLATGYSCALQHPPRSALGMSLHAVTLMIHQRLTLDVERYADLVDLRVVPPLCPISVAPTDFSQADDLIRRAYRHTSDWLASPMPGSSRPALPLHREHPRGRRASPL